MGNSQGPRFRTKREVAIDTLREAISSGRYVSGQSLRQVQLVQDLGLGSTPVREAVLELLGVAFSCRRATALFASPNSI